MASMQARIIGWSRSGISDTTNSKTISPCLCLSTSSSAAAFVSFPKGHFQCPGNHADAFGYPAKPPGALVQ